MNDASSSVPLGPHESAVFDVAGAVLTPLPLDPAQVVSGAPTTAYAVLDVSADGRVERGIWEHTPGVTTDVEADELFVVVSGRATVEVDGGVGVPGGSTLELRPGVVGILRAGAKTTWTVHETLRKVWQTTA
ncbi:MAG: cupin domain-containing protein, partial [Solirubrobacteraceae bacterium]|nr:cupin domain-containing protein [Solirubrobacteraceae bacterium]